MRALELLERGARTLGAALAHQHVVENQAGRVDVRALIDGLAARLFRRHVLDRPDDRAEHRGIRIAAGRPNLLERRRPSAARDTSAGPPVDRAIPKSMISASPSCADHDVGGLQIAMHDAGGMRGDKARHDGLHRCAA